MSKVRNYVPAPSSIKPSVQPKAVSDEPAPWSPAWVELHKEDIINAAGKVGVKMVSEAQFQQEVDKRTQDLSPEAALASLGIDVNSAKAMTNVPLADVTKLINDVAAQIDVLYGSSQWRTIMTPEQKASLHAVRVFIRQLRNENAPPGQAGTLMDLMRNVHMPEGALGTRGVNNKTIRVTQKHLAAVGVGG